MAESHADLLRRWFTEVWNEGREDSVAEMFAADGVMHGLGEPGRDAAGPAGFLPFFREFRRNATDIHFTVEDVVESGDKAAARWTVRLRPVVAGSPAPAPAVHLTGMSFVRVQNGQLVEGWNNWDALEYLKHVQGLDPTMRLMP